MTSRTRDDELASALSVVLLLAVFIAGALTGAVVLDSGFASPAGLVREEPTSGGGLLAELGLSPEQMGTVDSILASKQPVADSILGSSLESIRELMQEADAEVRAVLTPEQTATYEALLAGQPLVRAVRRTTGPTGTTVVDTIR